MTQKFHENETATIALYKYHDLLRCEDKLEKLQRLVDWEKIGEIQHRLQGATPGDWYYDGVPYNGIDAPAIYGNGDRYIAQTTYFISRLCESKDMQGCTEDHNVDGDTIFLANTKRDVEYLLELVKAMKF